MPDSEGALDAGLGTIIAIPSTPGASVIGSLKGMSAVDPWHAGLWRGGNRVMCFYAFVRSPIRITEGSPRARALGGQGLEIARQSVCWDRE
jgi:hypothetical protein